MWCPLGYTHLHEIEDVIESAASRIVPWESNHEHIYLDEGRVEYDYENSGQARRMVIAGKLFELFCSEFRHQACAASLSGHVIRLSGYVVRPVIFNHWMKYEKLFAARLQLLYVDISTGKIDVNGVAKRFQNWNAHDGDIKIAELWQDDAIRDLGDLDGWVVCYPSNEIELSTESLVALWDNFQSNGSQVAQKLGRPRRQEEAAQAYHRIYPHGHGTTPWKEVIAQLADAGIGVSQKTLQRALGQKS